MGGASDQEGWSVATDANGNVYTAGRFYGTADFDPGGDTYNLTSAGDWDIFISKLDSFGNFIWAKRVGGSGGDETQSLAVDVDGNVYTTGHFTGIADFDPGAGTANLTSLAGWDIFVLKLDSSGNFAWVRQFGGGGDQEGLSVAVDTIGNVFTTGYFNGTVDFDPGEETANLTSSSRDVFVSKLDNIGNYVWARQMAGGANDRGTSLAVDANGNVCTTGHFYGTVDFDPGPGTANLTSSGYDDVFVSKLDSLGNYVWAKQMGGLDYSQGLSLAVDGDGNVYTTGRFRDTADFDPSGETADLSSPGNFDIFVSKLSSAGDYVWAKQLGGSDDDERGWSIAVDTEGNVYTTGFFSGTADFDPGLGTANLTSAGNIDVFVSKLDGYGTFDWAARIGASGLQAGNSLCLDTDGNIYITGQFTGTVDFDPGLGTASLTAGLTGSDIFVVKLSGPYPGVEIVARADSDPTNRLSVTYAVNFTEDVSGVEASDFVLTTAGVTGALVTGVSGGPIAYNVTVNTGSGDGSLRLDVADDDTIVNGLSMPLGGTGVGNGDFLLGEVYTIDKTAPTAILSSTANDPTNAPVTVNVVLSESSTNFTSGDITATNATVSGFSGSGSSYSFTLTPQAKTGKAQGLFSAVVNAGACTDSAGNANTTSNTLSRTYDSVGPTVTLSSDAPQTVSGPITVDVTLSEPTTDIISDDITATNATVSEFSGSGAAYTFVLTPLAKSGKAKGPFSALVSAGTCTDALGHVNTASNTLSRTYTVNDTLIVVTPNGGEKWRIGKKGTIQWTSSKSIAAVKIELLRHGQVVLAIKAATDNDGHHKWRVKDSVQPGRGYKVRISDTTNANVTDTSDAAFRIKAQTRE